MTAEDAGRARTPRKVCLTFELIGMTDRDPWEWGDAIARNLRAEFNEQGAEFGPVDVACTEVADVE